MVESSVELSITYGRTGVYSGGKLPRKLNTASWSHAFASPLHTEITP